MRGWVVLVIAVGCGAPSAKPRPLPPLPGNVVRAPASIALGETWGCARTSAEVRCWGYQIPGLPIEPAHVAGTQRIPALDGAIAGGRNDVCAIMPGGSVTCAGLESVPNGKFDVHGYPFHDERPRVQQIAGLTGVVQLSVGAAHVCALLGDGTVRCWGQSSMGELGLTRTPSTTPIAVPGIDHVVEIASGMAHTCARLTDGTVRCWGGRGPKEELAVRTIDGVDQATQLACGWSHSCARIEGGTVRCWGGNDSGQLGDGTREQRKAAVPVIGLTHVAGIALGDDHSCARLEDGHLACWGDNTYGELGAAAAGDVVRVSVDGASTFHWKERYRPAVVPGIADAVDLALGSYTSCARTADGAAYCFGRNDLGQVGPRDLPERPVPVRIPLE